MTDNPSRLVKTTRTSIRILETIQKREGATTTELNNELPLAKSTIHNHLATLRDEGLLVKEDNEYHIGLRFLEWGCHARNRRQHHTLTRQYVHELATEIGETTDFLIEENGRMITVAYAGESRASLSWERDPFELGSTYRMHNTAGGKAVLAEYSKERVQRIIDRWGLPATTSKTITDQETLFSELKTIQKQGYATNEEEFVEGFHSIAVAIAKSDGGILGALSVGGPTYRIPTGNEAKTNFFDDLMVVKQNIEQEISEKN